MPANVIILIVKRPLNNRLHHLTIQSAMYASDVGKAKHSVAANIEVRVRRQTNAQILGVAPIIIVHGDSDDCET